MTFHNQHLTQETLTAVNWFFSQYETASPEQLVSSAFSDPTVVGDLSGSRHVPASVLAKGMVERVARGIASCWNNNWLSRPGLAHADGLDLR